MVMLCNLFSKGRVAWLISFSLLAGAAGFILYKMDIHLPLWTGNALVSVPFYAFGYIIRKQTLLLQSTKYYKVYIFQAFALFGLTYLIYVGVLSRFSNLKMVDFVSYYLCGITGTLAILLLSKKIITLPLISYYGRYSICILMTHFLFVPILYNTGIIEIAEGVGVNALLFKVCYFILVMLSYLLIIPLMIKYLPHVCAQKDLIKGKQRIE